MTLAQTLTVSLALAVALGAATPRECADPSCSAASDENLMLQLKTKAELFNPDGLPVQDELKINLEGHQEFTMRRLDAKDAKRGRWHALTQELAANDPSGILQLTAPVNCGGCELDKWDQYAVCQEAIAQGKTDGAATLSFGVMGYDVWGEHLQKEHGFLPRLYDCFDLRKPELFDNVFNPICLGAVAGEQQTGQGTKLFETLRSQLDAHAGGKQAIVKIDVESSEYDVIEALEDADFDRLSSVHIEYHFNSGGGCPQESTLKRWKASMEKVGQRFAVIDSWVNFYDSPERCMLGAQEWPRLLTVSYAPKKSCTNLMQILTEIGAARVEATAPVSW